LVEGAGWYDVESEAGRGFVTVQVDGMGVMAGPPARGAIPGVIAGRAFAEFENAAIESRLMVIENNIAVAWWGAIQRLAFGGGCAR
jgi:hypothetical protein